MYLIKPLPALAMVIVVILSSHIAFANNIVWSDEFNSHGSSPDPTKWTFEIGNGSSGWGNSELEYYTSSLQNAYVSNGVLNIVACTNTIGGYSFTSARMKTQYLYNTPVYGTLEWRAKLPSGIGMWPALWLLGSKLSPRLAGPTVERLMSWKIMEQLRPGCKEPCTGAAAQSEGKSTTFPVWRFRYQLAHL